MQPTCCPLVAQDMRGDGVPPNLINFNLAVKALGKGGDWERATRILGEMKSGGVDPDERTFSAAIEVLQSKKRSFTARGASTSGGHGQIC